MNDHNSKTLPDVADSFAQKKGITLDDDTVPVQRIPQILTEGRRRGRLEVSEDFESKLEELVPDLAGLKVKVNADDYMMKAYTVEMYAHKDEREYINFGGRKEVVDPLLSVQFTFNEAKDANENIIYMMNGHTRSDDLQMVEHMESCIINNGQKPLDVMNDFLVDFIAKGKFQPYLDHHNKQKSPVLDHNAVDAEIIEIQ